MHPIMKPINSEKIIFIANTICNKADVNAITSETIITFLVLYSYNTPLYHRLF